MAKVSLHTGLTSRPDEIYCLQFPHITPDPYKFAGSVQELGLKAEVLKVGEEIVL